VSLLCQQPESRLKCAQGVVVLSSDLRCRHCASRTAASNVPGVVGSALRFVVSVYASRAVASNVPGALWLCPPVCGFVVIPAGQRCKTCQGFWSFPPIGSVVVLPADSIVSGVFTIVVALSSDLGCRSDASRTAVSNVPWGFGFCPSIRGIVVMPARQRFQTCPGGRYYATRIVSREAVSKVPASDLWCCCYASRAAISHVSGVLVLPSD